mmetsp:Transcript_16567/g.32950  ORF Transcript_16567/g.32950 Transcript_16567/m.32950 type:complete len:242 (+) Transcript_16567:190-915(+)
MHPPFPEREHTRLGAHGLTLCPAGVRHLFGHDRQVNAAHEIHPPRVYLHDGHPVLRVRVRKLDFAIDPSGPQKRRIEDVDPISGHDHLDILRGLEPVELVQQLEHGALHLAVAPGSSSVPPAGSNGIDFVHEDDGGCCFPRHYEKFADHPRSLPDVFLYELRPADADEGAVGMVGHGARQKRLTGSRRSVQQYPLGLGHAEALEQLRVLNGELDDFLDLHDLFLQPSDHIVRRVGNRLHLH